MSNEDSNEEIAKRIERLVTKVKKVSLELSTTNQELRNLQKHFTKQEEAGDSSEGELEPRKVPAVRPAKRREFRIGNRVEVIDNYKGNKGKIGKIKAITGQQVVLTVEGEDLQIRKWKENVRRVKK